MKRSKIVFPLLLAAALLLGSPRPLRAEILKGEDNWSVTFTEGKKMTSTFGKKDIDDVLQGLQPGDEADISLTLSNENKNTTDWYMTNKVLYSLEDRSKNKDTGAGAYTYKLSYFNNKNEERVLFDSDTIGGTKDDITPAGEGLHEATSALQDFFYLDKLEKGQSGRITLKVVLDGETQGNDYQDTLADLQMNFAVELDTTSTTTTPPTEETKSNEPSTPTSNPRNASGQVVRTGDDSNLPLYYVLMGASGVILLILGLVSLSARRKKKDGEGDVK